MAFWELHLKQLFKAERYRTRVGLTAQSRPLEAIVTSPGRDPLGGTCGAERRKYVGSYQQELTNPSLMDGH